MRWTRTHITLLFLSFQTVQPFFLRFYPFFKLFHHPYHHYGHHKVVKVVYYEDPYPFHHQSSTYGHKPHASYGMDRIDVDDTSSSIRQDKEDFSIPEQTINLFFAVMNQRVK